MRIARVASRVSMFVFSAVLSIESANGQVLQDGIFRFHRWSGCPSNQADASSKAASYTLGTCSGGESFKADGTVRIEVTAPETITGTLIPDTFLMQLTTPIKTKATATITAAPYANRKDLEDFSIRLEVTTFNSSNQNPQSGVCRKEVRADGLKSGPNPSSVTLTATAECEWTQLGLGFRGEGGPVGFQETKVEVQLFSKNGFENRAPGGEISTLYAFLPRRDTLTLFNERPTSDPQVPETEVDFSGQASVMLRTKRSAELVLRLFDAEGNRVASSQPVRINSAFAASEQTFTMPRVKIPSTAYLELKALLIDASSRVIKEDPGRRFSVATRCDMEGKLKAQFAFDTFWMPNVPVELIDTSTNAVVATTQSRPDPDDPSVRSFYCFKGVSLSAAKQYRLRVRLHDQDAPLRAKLMIFERPDATAPSEIQWKPFGISSTTGIKRDLIVRAGGDLDVADPFVATGAAATYWHVWRQIHELWPQLFPSRTLAGDLPLEIYLHGAPPSHYCPTQSGVVCPSASSITLDRASSLPGSHPGVLRHEFGHHVLRELYGTGMIVPPGFDPADTVRQNLNHSGFGNSTPRTPSTRASPRSGPWPAIRFSTE